MHPFKSFLLASSFLSMSIFSAQAELKVVASIKPVHSLVAAVMDGVGSPTLLVQGANSPHDFTLKPSQAASLENADLVFWIGHELEAFLEKPLEVIAAKAKSVELIDAHDLVKLKLREGGAFDEHGHDDHDDHAKAEDDHDDHDHDKKEDDHDDHDHDKNDHDHDKKEDDHDDHDHDKKEDDHDDHDHDKKAEGDHDDHDEHAHGEFDVHVWLDPVNAKALVHEIEETLAEADPDNAAKYEANAEVLMTKLDSLTAEVTATLAPVKGKGFVVFHDAYQNFEERFGLTAVGSITVSPEVVPGVKRVRELQTKVKELKTTCVFSEPQFDTKLVTTVTEGTSANTGVLDPLGTSIEDGPDLYFKLIRNMASSFKSCLSKEG